MNILEISEILTNKGISFYDENLKWDNAHLSYYKDKLNDSDLFVGIELKSDCREPKNYFLIDHHNENSEKHSSIPSASSSLSHENISLLN